MFVVISYTKHWFAKEANIFSNLAKRLHIDNTSKINWEPVIGLEIHAQINSSSKLFSGAGTEFGKSVNTSVSIFDAAVPGTLPVLNRRCVEAGVLTALALSCKINEVSLFDRKHYFYSDLPAGYQITQQRLPLAEGGHLQFPVFTSGVKKKPYTKTARITQLQLEQDSGKSLHDVDFHRSLIDLNRAGIPLMELVFEPDLVDGEEAAALVHELCLILQRLGTCSCKMEEGALRVDANVSIHQTGEPLGIRTEIKNIGSIRAVANAIQYEIQRQKKEIENGGKVVNETRAWDAETRSTVPMRDKEQVQDYRYMPEPNLPPLRLFMGNLHTSKNMSHNEIVNVEVLANSLPELPEETRNKLLKEFKLTSEMALILVNEERLLDYFKSIVNENNQRDPHKVANILIMDFLSVLNKNDIMLKDCQLPPETVGQLVDLLQSDTINLKTLRSVLQMIISGTEKTPREIVEMNGWTQITDKEAIQILCKDVIARNSDVVKQYKAGKKNVYKALLGEVAKVTNGRAKMSSVAEELINLLKKQ